MTGLPVGASTAEVLAVAADLVPLLVRDAEQAEEERRVTDAVMAAADERGLFALAVPRAHGGLGLGLEPLAQLTRLLGTGCPASAWTISFLVLHNGLLARCSEALQAEVFAGRGYALLPAPLAPTGTLTPVEGGWELRGRWEWATGVNHADWVMVNALEVGADAIAPRFAVLPIDEVEVDDVWFTSGMRATGSNTVRVEGVVVPAHRTIAMADMVEARPAAPGHDLGRYPLMPALALIAAAPALGAAEAAVDAYADRLRERVLAYTLGEKAVDQPAAQIRLATALADVRAAGAVFDDAIARLDAAVDAPGGATTSDRMAARLAAANVVRMSRDVIGHVCAGAGASVYFSRSPLQRLQRDVEVLKGHVIFDWDRTAELAGRIELGLEVRPTDLV
jgi:alkylation response protein AidB-like acyl-CoA dehydrogenase